MEKRSRRRTRDLVTQPAFQGLSENEIGCARISIMARSTSAPFKGRIQNRKTYHFHSSNLTCNARPVHTVIRDRIEPAAAGPAMSALPRLCCKSRFAPMIKNSKGRRRGFRVKMWGTSSPNVKLTGDFDNAIASIRIGDRFPFRVFAKNS